MLMTLPPDRHIPWAGMHSEMQFVYWFQRLIRVRWEKFWSTRAPPRPEGYLNDHTSVGRSISYRSGRFHDDSQALHWRPVKVDAPHPI